MRFSIVIPVYNKEKYLKYTLDSVLKQTMTDYEVIIVDDCSADRSVEIARAYETDGRFCVYTKKNEGVSATRNYGIMKAKGDYVCFLDADDLWLDTYLEETENLLKVYGDRNFVCHSYELFSNNPQNIIGKADLSAFFKERSCEIDYYHFSFLSKRSVALTSGVVIKRSHLLSLDHLFPEGVSMGEDADLWCRAAAMEKIIYDNKPLFLYRCFANGSLSFMGESIKKSFPYWRWYSMPCYSKYKDKYTTLMIYAVAKKGLKSKEHADMRLWLSKSKGTTLLIKRWLLYIRSLL